MEENLEPEIVFYCLMVGDRTFFAKQDLASKVDNEYIDVTEYSKMATPAGIMDQIVPLAKLSLYSRIFIDPKDIVMKFQLNEPAKMSYIGILSQWSAVEGMNIEQDPVAQADAPMIISGKSNTHRIK